MEVSSLRCRLTSAHSGLRSPALVVLVAAALIGAGAAIPSTAQAQATRPANALVRLSGEVPPLLARAGVKIVAPTAGDARQPLTLTVTLRRTDEADFQQFLVGVQNPKSPTYRHFMTQQQLADRFGPSQAAYSQVFSWLKAQGLQPTEGSSNRLTISATGTRQQVEHAFGTGISNFEMPGRVGYANTSNPVVPSSVGPYIQSVAGLSDLAKPAAPQPSLFKLPLVKCSSGAGCDDVDAADECDNAEALNLLAGSDLGTIGLLAALTEELMIWPLFVFLDFSKAAADVIASAYCLGVLAGIGARGLYKQLQNAQGSATPTVITQQPSNQTVAPGQSPTFSDQTSNPGADHQWQMKGPGQPDFTNVPGATGPTVTGPPATPSQDGTQYRDQIGGPNIPTIITDPATETVDQDFTALVVTMQPQPQTVTVGQTATFTSTADGSPEPGVQWQVSTDGGNTFSSVPGGTSDTLTIPNTTASQSGELYRAVFSNVTDTAQSNAVTLTVQPGTPQASFRKAPTPAVATSSPSPTVNNAAVQAIKPQVSAPSNNQKIGFLEFDTYHQSDVVDWLNLLGMNPSLAGRVSKVNVNGGVASTGAGESEVLLDIDTSLGLDPAQGDARVVYDAPPSTSFAQMFNTMINDGDTVISNSWSQCEDQTSLAEAQGIDSVLAQASASGISVFNGTGDNGSTCLDGSPNTIGVPADSPNATAVGGTSPVVGPGVTVQSQTWWDGSAAVPPTGQGGFGVSRYFSRPTYQNGHTTSAMRSVPDIAVIADPRAGVELCQADAGGCPNGLLSGGTSMAAPEAAALTAATNESLGSNIGNVNNALYPLAATSAFSPVTGANNGFAHVGLGPPNFSNLILALRHQVVGTVSASQSEALSEGPAAADGSSPAVIAVVLTDASGFPVAGKTVTLTPAPGHSAMASRQQAVTDPNGIASFEVTDTVAENVLYTVHDATDGITLGSQPTVQFVPPPSTSGSVTANPSVVANDGSTPAVVTVRLQNKLGQGAEGKEVTLSEDSGDAQITPTGTSPRITDGTGRVTFDVTDQIAETVTFTAVDVTDGDLPVPGSASVTFSGDTSSACNAGMPTGQNGATVSTFASGFPDGAEGFNSCEGVFGLAFDGSGNLFAADQFNGNLYKIPPGGGTADPSTLLSNALDPGAYDLTFGKDGELYGVMPDGTTGNIYCTDCGAVVQLNSQTGAIVRTLTSTLDDPTWIATDPISGDLFVTNGGAGSIFSSDLWRIQNPSGSSPTVSVYNGSDSDRSGFTQLVFAPDGTLYALNRNNQLVSFGGTNTSQPATETVVASVPPGAFGLVLGPINSNGTPSSVYLTESGNIDQVALPSGTTTQVESGGAGNLKAGPDGCLYAGDASEVLKVTNSSGSCDLTPSSGVTGSTTPVRELSLVATSSLSSPPAGSSVSFTAAFHHVGFSAGTPVRFLVTGANQGQFIVDASANGTAAFSYAAFHPRTDTVTARAFPGGAELDSLPITFTWASGKDTSDVSLAESQLGGPAGTPATISAGLYDVSQVPATPVGGATLTVSLGTKSCTITTTSSGVGSCRVTPPNPGILPVSASFAGDTRYTPSSDTASFFATAPRSAPAFTSAATHTMTSGTAFTYSVTTTGTPTPAITLASGSTLPSGVTLTDRKNGTATLAGTSSVAAGIYKFTIRAANGVSPNATQPFTLTVTTSAPPGNIFATTFEQCTILHVGYNRFVNGTIVHWSVTSNGFGTVASGQFTTIGGGKLGSKTYHFLDIALGTTLKPEPVQSHIHMNWAGGGTYYATRDPGC